MTCSKEVISLKNKLKLDSKPRFERNFKGKIFPFTSREPERVKFKDSFSEIIGVMTRYSMNKSLSLQGINQKFSDNLKNEVVLEGARDHELIDLFDLHQAIRANPRLLLYIEAVSETKQEQSEKKGKIELGVYLSKLFKLNESEDWKSFINQSNSEDLYTEVLLSLLPELSDEENMKAREFVLLDQFLYLDIFQEDLKKVLKNKKFFLKHMDLFFSYYYFIHIITFTFKFKQLSQEGAQPLYFSYEKESISAARLPVNQGYNLVQSAAKYLLIDNDVLDYLNELIGEEKYYSYQEILEENFEFQEKLDKNLIEFNQIYGRTKNRTENEIDLTNGVELQIKQLTNWLKEDVAEESISRFKKSYDEFYRLGFVKSRGRLGRVLNASSELILLFVAIIVGNDERMLLKNVFLELERRGLYFDSQTSQEVRKLFEEVNILEKMSDSGDAQYVKSIL